MPTPEEREDAEFLDSIGKLGAAASAATVGRIFGRDDVADAQEEIVGDLADRLRADG